MLNNKKLIFSLFLAALVLLVTCYLFIIDLPKINSGVNQTYSVDGGDKNQIEFTTYVNEDRGYSINHPKQATITEIENNRGYETEFLVVGSESGIGMKFIVSVTKLKSGMTIENWFSELNTVRQAPTPSIQKEVSIDNEKAYYTEFSIQQSRSLNHEGSSAIIIYVKHNDFGYRIYGFLPYEKITESQREFYREVADIMINSFKFTD